MLARKCPSMVFNVFEEARTFKPATTNNVAADTTTNVPTMVRTSFARRLVVIFNPIERQIPWAT